MSENRKSTKFAVCAVGGPLASTFRVDGHIYIYSILVGCKHRSSEVLLYIGGRGLVSQIIEPVTFARCAFIIALRNIALDGYLDTRRNI